MAKKIKKQIKEKKVFLSDRQKKVSLILMLFMIVSVPMLHTFHCRMKCLKRVKTPYPEIACRYECPWFWQKK